MVQTGRTPGGRLVYPGMGAVVSLFKGYDAGYTGLIPPYVVLTELAGPVLRGRLPGAALQAVRHRRRSGAASGLPSKGSSPRASPTSGSTTAAICCTSSNTLGHAMPGNAQLAAFEEAEKQAYDLILGDAGKVFDLSQEKDELRDRYGRNTLRPILSGGAAAGRARRSYVTINYNGWDTHKQNFQAMRRKLPELDKGLADAAAGPVRPRPARQHHRLVLRRVRPHAEGPMGTALERRTRSWQPGFLRRRRRRRIQGRPRRRLFGRQGRKGSNTYWFQAGIPLPWT